jgi:hypothetical protein
MTCLHERTIRGGDIVLRYGSARTQVCRGCGAWRMVTHHEKPVDIWPWRTDPLNLAMIEEELE